MTTLLRRPGFFTVCDGHAMDLGAEWPEGAVLSLAKQRSAVVLARDRATVLEGGRVEDALSQAESMLDAKRSKGATVGRSIGRFGRSTLYERVADLLAKGTDPDFEVLASPVAYKGDKELKTVHMKLTKAAGGRFVEGYASTPNLDRDYDSIDPTAFNESLVSYMQNNPMMLLNHRSDQPVGKLVGFEVRPEGFWVRGEIAYGTQSADECWKLIQQDVLRTFSVQFIILDSEMFPVEEDPTPDDPTAPRGRASTARKITKAELIEVSVVSIPCNREATFTVAKALKDGSDVVCSTCKAGLKTCECGEAACVVPYRATKMAAAGKVDLGRDAIVGKLGREADRLACLVQREGCSSFKHHGLQGDDLVLDPYAVRAALASLLAYTDQGRDALTETERKAAYHHLSKHCAELGIVAPPLGKGPTPEMAATLFVDVPVRIHFSREDGFETEEAATEWLSKHGFQSQKVNRSDRVAVADGGFATPRIAKEDDRRGSYALDKGVSIVVYAATAREGEIVNVRKNEEQAAPAATPATPVAPAPAPTPVVAAVPATAQTPAEVEETVEMEVGSPEAMHLARIERVNAHPTNHGITPADLAESLAFFESAIATA